MFSFFSSFFSSPTFQGIIGGLTRHLLTAVGGALAAKGTLQSGLIDQIVGAGLAFVGSTWSIAQKSADPVVPAAPAAKAAAKK